MLQGFVILGHLFRRQRLGCIRLPGSLTPCFTALAFFLCALCSVLLPVSLVQLCSHVFPFITIIQCISAVSFPNFFVSSSSIPRVGFQSSSVTQFSSSCPYNKHRACSQLACESCIWSSLPFQHTWTRQARCFSHAWIQMFLFRGTNQRSAEQFQLYSFRHGQVLAASTETQLRDHLSSPAQFLTLLPSLT